MLVDYLSLNFKNLSENYKIMRATYTWSIPGKTKKILRPS